MNRCFRFGLSVFVLLFLFLFLPVETALTSSWLSRAGPRKKNPLLKNRIIADPLLSSSLFVASPALRDDPDCREGVDLADFTGSYCADFFQSDYQKAWEKLFGFQRRLLCLDTSTVRQMDSVLAAALESILGDAESGRREVRSTANCLLNPSLLVFDILRPYGNSKIYWTLKKYRETLLSLEREYPHAYGLWFYDAMEGTMNRFSVDLDANGLLISHLKETIEKMLDPTHLGFGGCPLFEMAENADARYLCSKGCKNQEGQDALMSGHPEAPSSDSNWFSFSFFKQEESSNSASGRNCFTPYGVSCEDVCRNLQRGLLDSGGRSPNARGGRDTSGRFPPGFGGRDEECVLFPTTSTRGMRNRSWALDMIEDVYCESNDDFKPERPGRGASDLGLMKHEKTGIPKGIKDLQCMIADEADDDSTPTKDVEPREKTVEQEKKLNEEVQKAKNDLRNDPKTLEKVNQERQKRGESQLSQREWERLVDQTDPETIVVSNEDLKEICGSGAACTTPDADGNLLIVVGEKTANGKSEKGISAPEAVTHEFMHILMARAGLSLREQQERGFDKIHTFIDRRAEALIDQRRGRGFMNPSGTEENCTAMADNLGMGIDCKKKNDEPQASNRSNKWKVSSSVSMPSPLSDPETEGLPNCDDVRPNDLISRTQASVDCDNRTGAQGALFENICNTPILSRRGRSLSEQCQPIEGHPCPSDDINPSPNPFGGRNPSPPSQSPARR